MAHIRRIVSIAWSLYLLGLYTSAERHDSLEKNIISAFYEQLLNAKVNLTKSLIQTAKTKRDTSSLNVKWNHVWAKSIENSNSALMHYGNNKIFILSKDTVYNLNGEIPFKLIPIISLQDESSQISFIESIEWENILFLLLGLNNGQCRLMTATNKLDFTIRQTISNSDNPVDAEFFILNNELFVIIIFKQVDDTKVATRIYRWRSTHLDEEPGNHIKTVGAISVTTFTFKESVMFIIGQETKDKRQISSQVLRMKSNGEIEKIQFLPTHNPVSIKHFTMENENFIMVLEKNQTSIIYWWEGKEFVEWLRLPKIFGDFTLSIGYIRGQTLIVLYKQNLLAVYSMTWRSLDDKLNMGFAGEIVNAVLYDDEKIYLVVVTKSEIMTIQLVELIIDSKDTNSENHPKPPPQKFDLVVQCVKQLEDSINKVEDKLRFLQQTLPNILYDNEPANIHGNIKVLGSNSGVTIETGKIQEVLLGNNNITMKSQLINDKIADVSNKIISLAVDAQQKKTIPKSKTFIFETNLVIKEANINTIKTAVVNNVLFEPEKFISQSEDQRLKATIVSESINVEWLVADFLQNKNTTNLVPKNNVIGSSQILHSLYCKSMNLSSLTNGINIDNVMTSQRNITLKGETIVEDLIVEDMKAKVINEEQSLESLLEVARSKRIENLRLPDNTYIQNININEINGINIDNLINNLVLQGQNNTISGDLYFRNGLQANILLTEKLNDASISTRNSNYPIKALRDEETMRKKRDLNISNSINTKRRLVIYEGKVKVQGGLQVEKMLFNNTMLYVKNYSTPIMMSKIDHMFWNKHSNQTISVPVIYENGATIHGDFDVKSVNDYDLSAYNNTKVILSHLTLQNLTVNEFVLSENFGGYNILNFKQLNKSIVRREGKYFINAKKVFNNSLHVKHLYTEELNEIPILQAFILFPPGTSKWENIVISNLSVKGDINVNLLNNVKLSEEFKNVILTHKCYNLTSVQFTDVTGSIVDLQILNDMEFKNLIETLKLSDGKKRLEINFNGSLRVPAILSTQSVNGKTLKDILTLVVNGSNLSIIQGKKTFKSQVIVENGVSLSSLNKEVLQQVFSSRLSKSKQQHITGFYTMRKSKMGNLSTELIDGVNINNLIFINDPIVTIKSDIHMQDLTMSSNSTAVNILDGCTLPKVKDSLIFPNDVIWSSLRVDNDVRWKLNSSKGIQKLIDSAVLREKNQTISGSVVFNSTLKADHFESVYINDIKISFILGDAVMKNKSNQVVSGYKEFTQKIYCSQVKVLNDAEILSINKINITDLNKKLITYNTDNVINGYKKFKNGFKSFKFTCENGVNGVKAKDIVTETTESWQPYAVFSFMEITEDLTIGSIKNINLTEFIKSIVTLNSESLQIVKGQFVFKESVQLAGESTIKSINSINIDETLLTYDVQINPQTVSGCTNMTAPIVIRGNFDVNRINGRILNETYNTAILDNENYTINGNIVFNKEQYVHTIHGKQYFSKDMQISNLNQSFENNYRQKSIT